MMSIILELKALNEINADYGPINEYSRNFGWEYCALPKFLD